MAIKFGTSEARLYHLNREIFFDPQALIQQRYKYLYIRIFFKASSLWSNF